MIKEAKFSDLESIARLHSESFEDHFLPKLGTELLSKYYKEFINDKNIFIISTDETNAINGLILGTPDSSVGRNQFIRSNKVALAFRIAFLCLKLDKDTWDRVVGFIKNRVVSQPSKKDVTKSLGTPSTSTISLLSICVSKNAKGLGVAKSLVEEFEERLIKNGYKGYMLTVHKNNDRANGFYKKIGMSVYKESDSEYGYLKKI